MNRSLKNKFSLDKNTFFILLLLLVALILIGTLVSDEYATTDADNIDTKEQRYVALNTRTLTYGLDGKIVHELKAANIENFPVSGESFITAPELFVFNQEGAAEWVLTSKTATIDKNRVLTLIDDVEVEGILEQSILKSIKTSKASINLNSQDITTDKKVTIIGQGFQSEGIGLTGNIKNQTAKLLKEVISIYDPRLLKESKNNE
ncbi:LPS export ABC transporter periplasmic protein LptC [Thorsellia kenyensis]|uniref:Lipopolysaccharide export system protein LptC n=1 Tax=Thorsellia kenyensis TaxID=1549888 RepID=A0ABV6C6T7_9GAMM